MILGLLLAAGSAALGGALALAAQRHRGLLEMTRTFAFAAAAGVVAFHLLPEVLPELGPTALLWIAAGFALPWLLEAGARAVGPGVLERRGIRGLRVAAEVGFAALIFHSLFEGLALLASLQARENRTDLEIAIVAHHAPLTAAVALPFLDLLGVRGALVRVGLVALAGAVGVVGGTLVPGLASGADAGVLQRATAVVAGALLHVVADEIKEQKFASPAQRAGDLLAAFVGLALAGIGAFLDLRNTAGVIGFARTAAALALAAAPALIVSIAIEAAVKRVHRLGPLRERAEGFLATAALLGWIAAGVRLALALLLGVSLWLAGRRTPQRRRAAMLEELAPRGPWLLILLAVAASVDVLAPSGWFAALRPAGLVVVAALLGLAAYASASGGAVLACALVHRGLPAELAVPFLALGSLPVRGTPPARAIAGLVAGFAAALATAELLTRTAMLRGAVAAASAVLARGSEPVLAQAAAAPVSAACLLLLVVLGLVLVWRSGVRGWFAPVRHGDLRERAPRAAHAEAR